MAEIRCPMCGKANPADQEVCVHCQARLKPLIASSGDKPWGLEGISGVQSSGNNDEDEIPDWLQSLRSDEPLDQDDEDTEGGAENGVDTPESSWEGTEDSGEAVSDWLGSLRGSTDEDEPFSADVHEDEDWSVDETEKIEGDDWLGGMRFDAEPVDDESEVQRLDDEPTGDEDPEWLMRIRSIQEAEAEDGDFQSNPEENLKDSLFNESAQDEKSFTFDESAAPEEGFQTSKAFGDDEDFDDLSFEDGVFGENGYDENGLDKKQLDQNHLEEGGHKESAAEGSEEIPDWLKSGLGEAFQEEEQVSNAFDFEDGEAVESDGEELPDWLGGFDRESEQEAETEDLPDWMMAAQNDAVSGADDAGDEDLSTAALEEDTLDWLQEPSTDADVVPAEQENELNWTLELEMIIPSDEEELDIDLEETTESSGIELDAAEDVPDWLKDLEATTPEITLDVEQDEEPVFGSEDVSPFDAIEDDDLDFDPLAEGELPEWMASISPDSNTGAKGETRAESPFSDDDSGATEEISGLDKAELPNWLEALRPVEASNFSSQPVDLEKAEVERAGPLSGLRGVLPAEPEAILAQKPKPYLIKLQVSDMQQVNAALLREMVKEEGEAKPLPKRQVIASQNLMRILIGVALIFAVLWGMASGDPQGEGPLAPPEVQAVNQLVSSVGQNAPVLIAVDYEPGWSGEMDAAASALINHLTTRGAFMTFVSTLPTGPAQAERLLDRVSQRSEIPIRAGEQYANLGFIPGGPAGLLSFAQTPQQVTPFTLEGVPAWQLAPLQPVETLANFALAVVVTENPDTARVWIEQVQPALGATPLAMVISAQAEPLVRPYFDTFPKQVNGFLSGLAGGASYENLPGQQGLARGSWTAFSTSVLAAAALILIGGVISAVSGVVGGKNKDVEGEDEL